MVQRDCWLKVGVISLLVCAWLIWNFWIPDWTTPWNKYGYVDFGIFYNAGKALIQHQNPYPRIPIYGKPEFFYPPTSLLLFGLYARFDFAFAKVLWFATYLTVFVAATLSCILVIGDETKQWFVLIAPLLTLVSYPFHNLMFAGQSDLLMASLTILSLVSQRLKHDNVSAFLLSSATLLKGPPLLLLIYFVLYRRDIKYLLRFLFSMALIVGASLAVVPIHLYWYYVVIVAPQLLISAGPFHQSIMSYLNAVNVNYLSPVISVLGVAIFAFFAFHVGCRKANKNILRDDAMFLMNILVYLLLGPQTSPYSYVWVILPLALFFSTLLAEEKARLLYLALVSFAAFLLSSNNYINPYVIIWQNSNGQLPLPINVAGNLMMTLSLIPIFVSSIRLFRQ